MQQVKRSELESHLTLRDAEEVVRRFLEETETYPTKAFRKRSGVCKVLAEEYLPLLLVAQSLRCVRSIRLYPDSHAGPDGEIKFWTRSAWHVQITCSSESYDRALMREQMNQGDIVSSGVRWRDPDTGRVVQRAEVYNTTEDVRARIDRILDAVEAKESNYHPGTDTLMVQDDPDHSGYLGRASFREKVLAAVADMHETRYRRTFILFGDDVVRAR